jgi:hypothetical protein
VQIKRYKAMSCIKCRLETVLELKARVKRGRRKIGPSGQFELMRNWSLVNYTHGKWVIVNDFSFKYYTHLIPEKRIYYTVELWKPPTCKNVS